MPDHGTLPEETPLVIIPSLHVVGEGPLTHNTGLVIMGSAGSKIIGILTPLLKIRGPLDTTSYVNE